jgi:tetratricopeptide (TPR) repeat protein/transcriptional regulator with XRE-family HTH domain
MPPSLSSISFATLLRRQRRAAGLTQEELAARAGMSAHGIADLEAGRRRSPRRDTVEMLADALALTGQDRAAFEAAARQQPSTEPAGSGDMRPTPQRRQSAAAATGAGAPQIGLVGRAPELALIERQLSGDGPPLLVFAGEPGIGKTRLLREAAARAEALGWETLEGGCHRRSGQEPYAPLLTALDRRLSEQSTAQQRQFLQGCGWLARLLPELAERGVLTTPREPLPPEHERRLMFAAVGRYLANVAGPSGTLLLLDDLQWAAPDALDLLAALLRSSLPASLRILAAYRDTEMRRHDPLAILLADLTREGLAARSPVPTLPLADAHALLDHLLPETAPIAEDVEASATLVMLPDLKQRLVMRTGGVPYFLISCAQAIDASVVTGAASNSALPIPSSVAETIQQRAAVLPAVAQDVLAAAAIIGRTAPRTLLVHVMARVEQPEDIVLRALDAACAARLLAEAGGDGYQFAHDLVREAVIADLTAARSALLHRLVAETLEQQPGELPVERLADHYSRAGALEKALIYLEAAGDRASAMFAHADAIGYYQQVVELLDASGSATELAHARERLATVYLQTAHYDDAIALFNQALDQYRAEAGEAGREGVFRVLASLGIAYGRRGAAAEGLARLEPLVAAIHTSSGLSQDLSQGLAPVYVALATLYATQGRSSEQLDMAEQAIALATSAGDARTLLMAQMQKGSALLEMDRLEESLHVLKTDVVPLAETIGDKDALARSLYTIGAIYHLWGELDQRQQYLERALALAEQIGDPSFTILALSDLGKNALWTGEWQRARGYLERGVALSRTIKRSRFQADSLNSLGVLLLFMGEEEGLRLLQDTLALAEQSQNRDARRAAHTALAERDLVEGRPEAAYARLEPLIGVLEDLTSTLSTTIYSLPTLAWAYIEHGELARAETLLTQTIARARELNIRPILADALRTQAMLAMKRARWTEAEQALEEALTICQTIRLRNEEAEVWYQYGLLCIQRGDPQQARQRLTTALAICSQLGERLYARQAERALADLADV